MRHGYTRRQRILNRVAKIIDERLGTEWGGKGGGMHPPGDHLRWESPANNMWNESMYVGGTSNDGSDMNIGYRDADRYLLALRHEEARSLAWFIIWRWWARGTWFGLKRRIWYWALRTKLNTHYERLAAHGDTPEQRAWSADIVKQRSAR
jgi:hypothetical protein